MEMRKQAQTENAQPDQGGTVGSLFVSRMNDLGEIQEIQKSKNSGGFWGKQSISHNTYLSLNELH